MRGGDANGVRVVLLLCDDDRENELERFLLDKGVLWAEKGVAPVLIEGVFDPEKPLEKRIKAAAKFSSAEEEAAKRKLELESLKSRSMMAGPSDIAEDELALTDPMAMSSSSSSSSSLAAAPAAAAASTDDAAASVAAVAPDSSAVPPAAVSSVVNSGAVAPATTLIELANMSAVPATPTRTPRKHSILTHTNPELLNTLNKMFSSPAPHAPNSALRARTPNRRASVAIGATASAVKPAAAATDSDASAPKEIKKSKSKLLKKLLGEEEDTATAPKPAFAATLPAGGLFGGPGGRPMSALAMAMGGGAGGAGAGGGMSFLDQIKARRAKNDGDASSSESVSASSSSSSSGGDPLAKTISFPLPPAPPAASAGGDHAAPEMPFRRPPNPFAAAAAGAGGGGMSFLEQIKARRKSDD